MVDGLGFRVTGRKGAWNASYLQLLQPLPPPQHLLAKTYALVFG